jgi:hypothetical protein
MTSALDVCQVSPIECFGEDKPVNAIVSSSWIVKKIGQNAHKNGIGMTSTIKVTFSLWVKPTETSSEKGEVVSIARPRVMCAHLVR